jgi:hypothetical protein
VVARPIPVWTPVTTTSLLVTITLPHIASVVRGLSSTCVPMLADF